MRVNLPNQITIGRLGIAFVFFALLSVYRQGTSPSWYLDVGLVIFILAAATDALDGYLARKHNQVTSLGRILDPFVDKVLVCGAFILFVGPSFVDVQSGRHVTEVQPWMVVLIVGRELLVSSLRSFCESRGISFGASFSGKAKMIVQSVAAPVILFLIAHPKVLGPENSDVVKAVLAWLTVLVTVASMSAYLMKSRMILSEASPS